MDYRVEKKEVYNILYFVPGEPGQKNLQQDVIAMLTDISKVPVFDFNAVAKLDLPTLTGLEPVFSLVKKSGRKLAVCCGHVTVQAVLDTAGYLAGAVVFPSETELENNLKGFIDKKKPKPAKVPTPSSQLQTVSLFIVIALLLLVIVLVFMLGKRVRHIETMLAGAQQAVAQTALMPSATPGEPSLTEEQLLKELDEIAPVERPSKGPSPELVAAGNEFRAAEDAYMSTHNRVAPSLEELGWLPSNTDIIVITYAVTVKGDLASVVLGTKNGAGGNWKIKTNGIWKKM
jgi:hypothetical protein